MNEKDSTRGRAPKPAGKVRVIVELRMQSPGDDVLEHLSELGLAIDRVIGNTLVGSIATQSLTALEKDDAVAAVEPSVPLNLH